MAEEVTPTLAETLASLGFTPRQIQEFEEDDERAWGWVLYARGQGGLRNPAGFIISKFRSGMTAPDPNAWRGVSAAGPDYAALLKSAEGVVRNTGHEYSELDLKEEFTRLGNHPRVGNGAVLTQEDEDRLLRNAQLMRSRHSTQQRMDITF